MSKGEASNWIKDQMQEWRDGNLTDVQIAAILAGVTDVIMENLATAKAATQELMAKRGVPFSQ